MKDSQFKIGIVFLTLLLLSFSIFMTIGGRDRVTGFENALYSVVSPVQEGMSRVSNFISYITYPIRNIFILSDENKRLSEENDKLKQEVIAKTLSKSEYNDLKRLKKALNYTTKNRIQNYVAADIISRSPSNWYSSFILNVGLNDGVTINSMVITEKGFVGLVYEVGNDFSKVITMNDIKGTVSFALLSEDRIFDGVVHGNSEGGFEGYFFDPKADVKIGDEIITSGLGMYPKGVMLGKIVDIVEDKEGLLKTIKVSSYIDFKEIQRVLVIPPDRAIEETFENIE